MLQRRTPAMPRRISVLRFGLGHELIKGIPSAPVM
jgi:hypothetical protein